jgi:sugar transferase (PEP-CTERM system associated)
MRLFNRYYSTYDLLLLAGDIVLAVLLTAGARMAMVLDVSAAMSAWPSWVLQGGVVAGLVVFSFYYSDLYLIDQTLSVRELVLRVLNGFGLACVALAGVCYLVPILKFRDIHIAEILIVGAGLLTWRVEFMRLLKKAKRRISVLIVGAKKIGQLVAEELLRHKHLGMEVVGFIGPKVGEITLSYGNPTRVQLPIFPRHSTLRTVDGKGVNRILLAESGVEFPAQELVTLRLKGVKIEHCHTFYERLVSKVSIADLQQDWIALSEGFHWNRWMLFVKRTCDIAASFLGLVLSAPLSLLTAIAIKLDSPGPVLHHQERVGQNERTFTIYKFRSMVRDAEKTTGPLWASENDPRVTRVGRIIRKLRIDEIPQLVNVLKGDMSFIGPRPERPVFVGRLKEKIPYYYLRFSIKPGITGWAQISYPYGDSEEDAIEKLQYDLYYIKNISPTFDLQIIFETVKIVLLGRGAR